MTEPKPKRERDEEGRFLPGAQIALRSGADSFQRTGKLPAKIPGRRRIQLQLRECRRAIEKADPDPKNPLRQMLIDQAIETQGCILLAFDYTKRAGFLRPDRLRRGIVEAQPIIHSLTGWLNTQRLAVLALGLDGKKAEKILDVKTYVAAFDAAKARAAKGAKARVKDKGRADIVDPGANGEAVSGQLGDGQGETVGDGKDQGSGTGAVVDPESSSSDIPGQADPGTREGQD